MREDFLWVEKYRPKTIDDTILTPNLKETFKQFLAKGNIPNMILSGTAGCGKTTVARALLEELHCDYIIINGSMNGNIDTLRNDIRNFASAVSLSGGRKYVILDEADYLNCLEENECILMSDNTHMALKDFSLNERYDIKSFNPETKTVENDVAEVVNITYKETYEVEMEDGRTIRVTDDHPFMVVDSDGNISERTIKDGFEGYEVISM